MEVTDPLVTEVPTVDFFGMVSSMMYLSNMKDSTIATIDTSALREPAGIGREIDKIS